MPQMPTSLSTKASCKLLGCLGCLTSSMGERVQIALMLPTRRLETDWQAVLYGVEAQRVSQSHRLWEAQRVARGPSTVRLLDKTKDWDLCQKMQASLPRPPSRNSIELKQASDTIIRSLVARAPQALEDPVDSVGVLVQVRSPSSSSVIWPSSGSIKLSQTNHI